MKCCLKFAGAIALLVPCCWGLSHGLTKAICYIGSFFY